MKKPLKKTTCKDRRETLNTLKLGVELWKIIRHFFLGLISLLEKVKDHRHQSYISYPTQVLLCVRILATVFQIGSMRKLTEDLNSVMSFGNISKILGLEGFAERFGHLMCQSNHLYNM